MDSFGNLKNLVDELYVLGSWVVVMAPLLCCFPLWVELLSLRQKFLASLEQLLT